MNNKQEPEKQDDNSTQAGQEKEKLHLNIGFDAAKSAAKSTFLFVLQVTILTLIIINFVGRVSVVHGSSMTPSLHNNNRVLVNLLTYKFNEPDRGEIIVFQCPIDPDRDYIKRIIGLPGETIEIKDGVVYINDEKIDEKYLKDVDVTDNQEKIEIPPNHYYVMGDNRENSEDSRFWGPIKLKNIKGKAQLIFWPPQFFQVFK